MSKEVYKKLSRAERKLKNTNKLRTSNSTLKIKYEGIKKLLEKKDKEIERLNNIINELEKDVKERIAFKEQEIKEFRDDLFTSNYEEIEVAKNEINIRRYEITELKDTLDKIEELKEENK